MKRWIFATVLVALMGYASSAWADGAHHHPSVQAHNPFDQMKQHDPAACPLHKRHVTLGHCPHSDNRNLPVPGLFADCGAGSKSSPVSSKNPMPSPSIPTELSLTPMLQTFGSVRHEPTLLSAVDENSSPPPKTA